MIKHIINISIYMCAALWHTLIIHFVSWTNSEMLLFQNVSFTLSLVFMVLEQSPDWQNSLHAGCLIFDLRNGADWFGQVQGKSTMKRSHLPRSVNQTR